MSGSCGERAGARSTSWFPFASVTETIAKRGSTASSKVSATFGGDACAAIAARRRHGADEVGVRATPRPAARAPRPRRARRSSAGASSELPAAPPRRARSPPSTTPIDADDERDDRERRARAAAAAERADRLDRRRRRVGALGAVPVDDGAVGVGLLDLRTCRSWRLVGLGQELEDRVLLGRHAAAGLGARRPSRSPSGSRRPRPSRSTAPRASSPAAGTNESIEKPSGTVSTTFVVLRVLLLGRDGEREDLPALRERDGRADAGRARTPSPPPTAASAATAATARGKRSLTSAPFT